MKKVLLVDDEKNFLLSLADMLKAGNNDFSVETAANGKIASKIMAVAAPLPKSNARKLN